MDSSEDREVTTTDSCEDCEEPDNDGLDSFLHLLPRQLAPLAILVAVTWSFIGVFNGTWEKSNGLYPLQRWLHDGESVTGGAIGGLVFLIVFLVLGIFGLVKVIRN